MTRFIILTFAVLGWSYWELSGGGDFVPETRPGAERVAGAAPEIRPIPEEDAATTVSRGASLPLVTTGPAVAEPFVPAGPAAPAEAGGTAASSARFLTPPETEDPVAEAAAAAARDETDGPAEWSSAADAVARQVALESAATALRDEARAASDAAATGVTGSVIGPGGQAVINASRVNMRAGPGQDFGVVSQLAEGTPVDILERRQGWVRIVLDTGREGYVADFLLDGL